MEFWNYSYQNETALLTLVSPERQHATGKLSSSDCKLRECRHLAKNAKVKVKRTLEEDSRKNAYYPALPLHGCDGAV